MTTSNWSQTIQGTPTAAAVAANPVFVWIRIFLNGSSTATILKRINLRDFTDGTAKIYVNRRAHRIRAEVFQFESAAPYILKGISIKGILSKQIAR